MAPYTTVLKDHPPSSAIAVARELVWEGSWARLTAHEILANSTEAIASITPATIELLADGLDHWGEVDAFAVYVAGPSWRDGQLSTRNVHNWLRSPDRWRRRAGVVSTIALNVPARGGHGDVLRTLAVCKVVVGDHDDMVVKAMS
jgi:3-methyladenine DNA glycosylase AlkD